MKTQRTLEPILSLMVKLEAQVRYAASFPEHAQTEIVSLVSLIYLMVMSVRRQQEEEARVRCRVYRFSSEPRAG